MIEIKTPQCDATPLLCMETIPQDRPRDLQHLKTKMVGQTLDFDLLKTRVHMKCTSDVYTCTITFDQFRTVYRHRIFDVIIFVKREIMILSLQEFESKRPIVDVKMHTLHFTCHSLGTFAEPKI